MTISKSKSLSKILPKLSHEIYKKLHETIHKSPVFVKQNPHFENGFACYWNGFLKSSKDSIKRGKKKPNLELDEQEAGTKMVVPSNKNFQENGTNKELGLRGRRGYAQILI